MPYQSETIGALAAALAKAQGAITHASKDSLNPAFRSKYADLASVWGACRAQLSANGIAVIQSGVTAPEGCVSIETTLAHSSGEWSASIITLPVSAKSAHGYGSAITYARRYGLAASVGVYQDDDDANAAVEPKAESIDADKLDSLIAAIESCDTLDGLKTTYTAAIKVCGSDQSAAAHVIAAKDAAKKLIVASSSDKAAILHLSGGAK